MREAHTLKWFERPEALCPHSNVNTIDSSDGYVETICTCCGVKEAYNTSMNHHIVYYPKANWRLHLWPILDILRKRRGNMQLVTAIHEMKVATHLKSDTFRMEAYCEFFQSLRKGNTPWKALLDGLMVLT